LPADEEDAAFDGLDTEDPGAEAEAGAEAGADDKEVSAVVV
jgi:hypothetical protein